MNDHPDPREILWLRIMPETPLQLGDQTGVSNFQSTLDHIPGSSVRGAIAARLLEASEQALHALFDGDNEPYFGNAYFSGVAPVYPFPLTSRTCKRFGGLSDGTSRDNRRHHGVFDVLLADFAYDIVSDPQFPRRAELQPDNPNWRPHELPNARNVLEHCQFALGAEACDQPTTVAQGYYAWDGGPLKVQPPIVTRTTHVGINRARGVAQDQLLFTQERLLVQQSAQSFFARVSIPHSKMDLLSDAIKGTHYVGRGRSRGNGRIVIQAEAGVAEMPLSQRLSDFQLGVSAALRPYADADSRVHTTLPGTLFSVTLSSPAILIDGGHPMRVPDASMLRLEALGDITCIRAWARTEVSGGWDNAARLPRRKALAVRAGSAFLYWAPPQVEVAHLIAALEELERGGIGDERERGFGQVIICAPFHTYEVA